MKEDKSDFSSIWNTGRSEAKADISPYKKRREKTPDAFVGG